MNVALKTYNFFQSVDYDLFLKYHYNPNLSKRE